MADSLPISAGRLRGHFERLLNALGPATVDPIPERFAFRLTDSVHEPIGGPSADIASVLALVDGAQAAPSPVFACACALVQPTGAEGELTAVGEVTLKLEAFFREYGRGSLLVWPGDRDLSPEIAARFDRVWIVRTWARLARALDAEGLLEPFFGGDPLTRGEARLLNLRFDVLIDEERDLEGAVSLAERMWRRGFASAVTPLERVRSLRAECGAWTRRGRPIEAARAARRVIDCWRSLAERDPAAVPFEELARSEAALATARYDLFEFEAIVRALEPFATEIEARPGLVTPDTHAAVMNTLCRAWIALDDPRWRKLARTRDLLLIAEPMNVSRTWCYLVHGLLRAGALDAARDELARIASPEHREAFVGYSAGYLRWLQVDLARREDRESPEEHPPVAPAFAAGLVAQSQARHWDRRGETAKAASLFEQARAKFALDVDADAPDSVPRFLVLAMDVAVAGVTGREDAWASSLESLDRLFDREWAPSMASWHASKRPSPNAAPRAAVERWLDAVPFF